LLPNVFWVVAALSVAVSLALHLEWRIHRRAVRRIPIRVHVNGTRGKSSVTRLIVAILRENGIRTVGKTTGTAARLMLPDGGESPVPRDGRANIGELVRTLRRAARLGAEAIVFECMAVEPDLQRVAEERIVQPTVTVVTNARPDHTDVQGANPLDIAKAFAVRPGGTLVTADQTVADTQGPRLAASGGSVHIVSADSIGPDDLDGMTYVEHPENVAVALETANMLGIARAYALAALRHVTPDPGVASVIELADPSGPWRLVNLFAANDPESTFMALDMVEAAFGALDGPVLLFTARGDRTARSAEFAAALVEQAERFSKLVVWGERTRGMVRRARRRGFPPKQLIDAGRRSPARLTELLTSSMNGQRTVVGIGNIIGPAQQWLEHLEGRAREWHPAQLTSAPLSEVAS